MRAASQVERETRAHILLRMGSGGAVWDILGLRRPDVERDQLLHGGGDEIDQRLGIPIEFPGEIGAYQRRAAVNAGGAERQDGCAKADRLPQRDLEKQAGQAAIAVVERVDQQGLVVDGDGVEQRVQLRLGFVEAAKQAVEAGTDMLGRDKLKIVAGWEAGSRYLP